MIIHINQRVKEEMMPAPSRAAIVVIDDDPTIGWVMRKLLEQIIPEHTIYTCTTGSDALKYITHNPVYCVITDYRIPFMDGLDIVQAVKKRWPTMPVIMFTGSRTPSLQEAAHAAGCYAVLQKPPRIETLQNLIIPLFAQHMNESPQPL